MTFEPIAITGRGCVLPGADAPDQFWASVAAGRSFLGGSGDQIGGYVSGFDPGDLDPQVRGLGPVFTWTLRSAAAALRESGQDSLAARAGLVLGNLSFPTTAMTRYAEHIWLPSSAGERPDARERFMSGLPAQLTARLLHLGQGGYALDAACASALYAIKLACDQLHSRHSDLMLAGGVNAADSLFIGAGFRALGALSPSGRIRPFHQQADGLLPGEGAVVFALMRLADAIAHGAPVFGVIRGIGLSNDGRSGGFLAPDEDGQVMAMRHAYESARIDPASVRLLEAHGTGAPTGDLVEVRSTSRVFAGSRDLPFGSVKSNIGHLLTAAGGAGLLKVLGALNTGVRPATLGAEEAITELAGTSLRLLQQPEPWDGMRRAAVSAFGFGGNNAHIIVDAWDQGESPGAVPAPVPGERVAIVAIGAAIGDGDDTGDLETSLLTGVVPGGRRSTVTLDAAGLRFPPRDMQAALAQQALALTVARSVADGRDLSGPRTMVIMGMGCDPEATRQVARLRVQPDVASAFGPELSPESVVGAMPNIVANRISAQFDVTGPGFTVAAEEDSGLVALRLGTQALRSGEADAVLAGAVDLSCEEVHRTAMQDLGLDAVPGDAAVVFLLRRLAEARRDGDPVVAILHDEGDDELAPADILVGESGAGHPATLDLVALSGHAHAAYGMVGAAVAAVALHRGLAPGTGAPARPALRSPRTAVVRVCPLGGPPAQIRLREADRAAALPRRTPKLYVYDGRDRIDVATSVETRRPPGNGPARLVLIADDGTDQERQAREQAALRWLTTGGGPAPDGVVFCPAPLAGETAFVYSGGSMAYPGMGRELMLAFPRQVDAVRVRCGELTELIGWAYGRSPGPPGVLEQIWGSSVFGQVHTEITRGLLGIRPHAALGYSSGESSALAALGVWRDLPAMIAEARESALFTRGLAGEFAVVRQAWQDGGVPNGKWASHLVELPADKIRAALAGEPFVHVMVINAPDSVVIGGEAGGCDRVLGRLGRSNSVPVPYEIAMHVPEIAAVTPEWRRLHRRACQPARDVRFYTGATCETFATDADSAAEAITAQTLGMTDFAGTVRHAWEDGVRVFVEHGPRSLCASWIGRILAGREHLAVSLDASDGQDLMQLVRAAAEVLAAGVPMNASALNEHLTAAAACPSDGTVIALPAHPPLVRPRPQPAAPPQPVQAVRPDPGPARQATPPAKADGLVRALSELHLLWASAHRRHLAAQSHVHASYIDSCLRATTSLVEALTGEIEDDRTVLFDRADLERLASGRVSDLFGPAFAEQDQYERQVRMPGPPMLLTDRVIRMTGEPASMGAGSVRTETDVTLDAWYLDPAGHMPAGLAVEAGQADLLLVSWLGVDLLNKGQRVYRLLGCEVTFHDELPQPGETLTYDITIDGHTANDDVRLFSFRYDCTVADRARLTMRKGQAGFFTEEELANTSGVLWEPPARPRTAESRAFTAAQVQAFTEGRPADCFGPGWERTRTHVRTPRTGAGRLRLLHEVAVFDPAARYLRAVTAISPDDWYFAGHFKDDPCMPGNLMFEGCLQAMAFYLAADGLTTHRDGWRFEPVHGVPFVITCRGQVTPASRTLAYEVFVTGLTTEPELALTADVLCTVDGVKACLVRGAALRLVPGWPLDQWRHQPPAVQRTGTQVPSAALGGLGGYRERGTVAEVDGFRFDYTSLLSCAWGKPSAAFGPAYDAFDGSRRIARLPGPPYHFMSRITEVRGPAWTLTTGSAVISEYDAPDDVWYLEQNDNPVMPLAVLMEVVLQAGGWLAAYVGSALGRPDELLFRNLDGDGRILREIGPQTRTLRTTTTLTDVAQAGDTIIETFQVKCLGDGEPVFELTTSFGFFTAQAMERQVGIPPSELEQAAVREPCAFQVDLTARPDRYCAGRLRLPGPMLLMLSRVTGYWPDGGSAGLGRLRAEKDIRPDEWFFKAHFFQDPVQPGSLGVQAIYQLMQFYMIERGMAGGLRMPRFQPIALGRDLKWRYRGQVVPEDRLVVVEVEILEARTDADGAYATGQGWLWVDGTRIYHVPSITARIAEDDGWHRT